MICFIFYKNSIDHPSPRETIFVFDESELVAKVNEYLFDVELMQGVGGEHSTHYFEKYYSKTVNSKQFIAVTDGVCPRMTRHVFPVGKPRQRFISDERLGKLHFSCYSGSVPTASKLGLLICAWA